MEEEGTVGLIWMMLLSPSRGVGVIFIVAAAPTVLLRRAISRRCIRKHRLRGSRRPPRNISGWRQARRLRRRRWYRQTLTLLVGSGTRRMIQSRDATFITMRRARLDGRCPAPVRIAATRRRRRMFSAMTWRSSLYQRPCLQGRMAAGRHAVLPWADTEEVVGVVVAAVVGPRQTRRGFRSWNTRWSRLRISCRMPSRRSLG